MCRVMKWSSKVDKVYGDILIDEGERKAIDYIGAVIGLA